MSDVVGSALIQIQPDFEQFDAQLQRSLEAAIKKIEKSTSSQLAVALKVDDKAGKSARDLEKSLVNTDVQAEALNRTLNNMNRNLSQLNRSFNDSNASTRSFFVTLSSIVNIFASFTNAINGARTAAQLFPAILGNIRQNLSGLEAGATGVTKLRVAFQGAVDAVQTLGTNLSNQIKTTNTVTKAFSDSAKAADQVQKKVAGASKASATSNRGAQTQLRQTQQIADVQKRLASEITASSSVASRANNIFAGLGRTLGTVGSGAAAGTTATFRSLASVLQTGVGQAAAVAGGALGVLTRRQKDAAQESQKSLSVNDRLNQGLFKLAKGIDQSSSSFERLSVQAAFGRKVFERLAVGTIKSSDDIAKAAIRANSALGGIFGGPAFAASLSTTIGLVTAMTGVLTAGSAAIIGLAQSASTLNESVNAIGVTLGEAGPRFAELIGNVNDLGLSQAGLNQALTPIVPLLQDTGLSADELATQMNALVRRAVDLSSIFNIDVNQALTGLGAAIRGEIEPARRLGITFNAADVEARALALGFQKVDGQFAESEKQLVRLQLALEKSTFAEGDFANTADSLANQQRILGAVMSELFAKFSATFLPAAQKLLAAFTELARDKGPQLTRFFQAIQPLVTRFAELTVSLVEVASRTGQVFTNLLLPSFEAFARVVDAASGPLIKFITTFFLLRSVTTILKTFSAALAALNLVGLSAVVGSLSSAIAKFAPVIGLLVFAFQSLGVDVTKAGAILGTLGTIVEKVEPIIRVFLFRMLALRSIPVIVAALNRSFLQLAGSSTVATAAATRLGVSISVIGARIQAALLGPLGLALTALTLFQSKTDETGNVVEEFKKSLEFGTTAEGAQKALEELLDVPLVGFLETGGQIARQTLQGIKGIFGGEQIDIVEEDELNAIKKRVEEVFKSAPDELEASLRTAEASTDASARAMAERIRPIFDQLNQASGRAIKKGAEEAEKALDDVLKRNQALLKTSDSLVSAQKELNDARKSIEAIDTQITEKNKELAKLRQQEFKSSDEEAVARERILDIDNQLRDLAQEREQLLFEEQRRQQEFLPTLAEFEDRSVLANIGLARAKRDAEAAQLALNEAVKAGREEEIASVNLAGLSVDEIRNRLNLVRASLSAQKAARKIEKQSEQSGQSREELQENALEAQIRVRDAEREVADIQQNRADFIRDNTIQQREFNEEIEALAVRERQLDRDRRDAARELQALLRGETGIKAEIAAKTKEITDLEKQRRDAAKEVVLAEKEVALAVAEAGGDQRDILNAQLALLEAKRAQLGAEGQISSSLDLQIRQLKEQQGLLDKLIVGGRSFTQGQVTTFVPPTTDLDSPLAAAAILLQKAAERQALTEKQVQFIARTQGVSIPTALAEGGYVPGAPGAQGTLAHIAEYGRAEAVLPLERPYFMKKVLSDPRVLNPILATLPQLSMSQFKKPAPVVVSAPIATAAPAPMYSAPPNSGTKGPLLADEKRKNHELAKAIAAELAPLLTGGDTNVTVNQEVKHPDPMITAKIAERSIKRVLDGL